MILELQGSGKVGHRGAFSLLSFSSLFLFVFNSPLFLPLDRLLWNFLPLAGVMDVSRDGATVQSAMGAPPKGGKLYGHKNQRLTTSTTTVVAYRFHLARDADPQRLRRRAKHKFQQDRQRPIGYLTELRGGRVDRDHGCGQALFDRNLSDGH
jgi:hypothetical protein